MQCSAVRCSAEEARKSSSESSEVVFGIQREQMEKGVRFVSGEEGLIEHSKWFDSRPM